MPVGVVDSIIENPNTPIDILAKILKANCNAYVSRISTLNLNNDDADYLVRK
jgi:hypothetical protein